tara:strand:+ start:61 stop:417 length:357 start_codon:yes stop_codon:yes gene_type:complete
MTNYEGPERREDPRIEANFVVSYKIEEMPEGHDLSQTKNISRGGILITSNRRFDSGTSLTINMRIPFVPQRIKLKGEVIDSKERVRDLIYETRIKFIGLDESFFAKLGDFIKQTLEQD